MISVLTGAYFFLKWTVANSAAYRTDQREVAEYSAVLSPSDPQTHFALARILEKTFLPDDFERSLREYELAAAASPSNYLIWQELGRALDRHGEHERAEKVLRRTLEMAPHYSQTKWTLGNFLLRRGSPDEGFTLIRDALESDPKLADAAVQSSYSWFDGDIERVRSALGSGSAVTPALIRLLVRIKKLDDAFQTWQSAKRSNENASFDEAQKQLLAALIEDKKYRSAFRVFTFAEKSGQAEPAIPTITNSGFEIDIKTQGAGPFEWVVPDSQNTQAAIIQGQKHSGERSLRILFDVTEAGQFRGISQIVAVEPGKRYRFEVFYKADLKTQASPKWEVAGIDGNSIAVSAPLANTSGWKSVTATFQAPENADAVIIRLARENCASTICPITGSLFIDDAAVSVE